ncbi:MAG: DMT family transporter [Ignavibacteria bacterium]|nr:DMT family transporter [Ignavibacteria bacterium]
MNSSRIREFKAELILLLLTVIWGGTFSLIKNALDHVSPFVFVSLRFGFASLVFLPFVYKHLKGLDRGKLLDGFWIGFWFFLGFILQTVGLQYTTASKSAFITGTFVIFTPLAQTIIERRPPSLVNSIGIGIVAVGIIFLSSGDGDVISVLTELGSTFNFGDFLTLLCAMSFGIYIVYLDVVTKRNNYLYTTFSQLAFTAVVSILLMPVFHFTGVEVIKFSLDSDVVLALIYTTLFATLFNITMMTKYQKEVPPVKAAIIYAFEPIFAAVIAFLLLGEQFTKLGLIGAGIIFFGLLFTEVFKKDEVVDG